VACIQAGGEACLPEPLDKERISIVNDLINEIATTMYLVEPIMWKIDSEFE